MPLVRKLYANLQGLKQSTEVPSNKASKTTYRPITDAKALSIEPPIPLSEVIFSDRFETAPDTFSGQQTLPAKFVTSNQSNGPGVIDSLDQMSLRGILSSNYFKPTLSSHDHSQGDFHQFLRISQRQ